MKKTMISKKILGIFLVLCFLISPLTPGIDCRAEAASVSDTKEEIFDEVNVYISRERVTEKEGNERIGYYWASGKKSGKNYIITCYYSKTKSGKGKAMLTQTYDYSEFFDDDWHGYQDTDIYTNGKTCFIAFDGSTKKNALYYGSAGKRVKKINGILSEFLENDSVYMAYDGKLYYSYGSEYLSESGEKWENNREVAADHNYVFDPKVGKPKRIMMKYDWIDTTGRYLYCYYFSKMEPGEWRNWSGEFQMPDYPVYDKSKIYIYDCKTGKFIKTLTSASFGLGDREFQNYLYYWYEDYDNNKEYSGYYGDSCDTILLQVYGNMLVLKAEDKVVIADELGNVISTLPNIEGYWYPLENEEDKFAAINGTRWRDEYMCPETIRIYDFKGNLLCGTEIEEGETLLKLTKNYAYTMPLEPERMDNGNFKIKVFKYDLKTGQRTDVCNVNALGSSDVKKAYTKKGNICYISLESLFSTKNYVYWSAEYSMNVKYDPDIFFSSVDGVPEMVYYRLDKRTNAIKKLTEKTYDKVLEKYESEFEVLNFYDYIEYNTGQREW